MPTLAPFGGSSSSGSRISVIAVTSGSGSHYVLLTTQTGSLITNEGATAEVYVDLPTASAGLTYGFAIQDGDGMRAIASAGDTIRTGDQVTSVAGYITSSSIGSVLWMTAINATEWICYAGAGIWTPN
jgi:hypothetical protein